MCHKVLKYTGTKVIAAAAAATKERAAIRPKMSNHLES